MPGRGADQLRGAVLRGLVLLCNDNTSEEKK
jgi:hypothetical protein